jgi:hypothetical protein
VLSDLGTERLCSFREWDAKEFGITELRAYVNFEIPWCCSMSTAAIAFRSWVAENARHSPLAATGAILVVVFVIFALFAPWIAPQDPAAISLPTRLDLPSHAH